MTGLYMRLAHNGCASRLKKRIDKTLDDFVNEFCDLLPQSSLDMVPHLLERRLADVYECFRSK
jgi:hypothetical protein